MLVNQEKVLLPVVVTSMALCELFYLIVAIWKFSLDAPYCNNYYSAGLHYSYSYLLVVLVRRFKLAN